MRKTSQVKFLGLQHFHNSITYKLIFKSKSPWWCHFLINTPLTSLVQPSIVIATGWLGWFWPCTNAYLQIESCSRGLQRRERSCSSINRKVASWIFLATLHLAGKYQQTHLLSEESFMSEGSHMITTYLWAPCWTKKALLLAAVYTWIAYSLLPYTITLFWFLCFGASSWYKAASCAQVKDSFTEQMAIYPQSSLRLINNLQTLQTGGGGCLPVLSFPFWCN